MLGNAQNISVWIFEPRHSCACRSGPDAQVILFDMFVPLEPDSCTFQVSNGRCYVGNLPTEDGANVRGKLPAHSEAEHDAVGIEYQREWRLFGHQTQPKRITVESLRFFCVDY